MNCRISAVKPPQVMPALASQRKEASANQHLAVGLQSQALDGSSTPRSKGKIKVPVAVQSAQIVNRQSSGNWNRILEVSPYQDPAIGLHRKGVKAAKNSCARSRV